MEGPWAQAAPKEVPPPPPLLENSARLTLCHFLKRGGCEFNQVDYMHLTRKGPRTIGGSAGGGHARIDTGLAFCDEQS